MNKSKKYLLITGLVIVAIMLAKGAIVRQSQAAIISTIETKREEMHKIGAEMNALKLKLTAETCKQLTAEGRGDNCTMDFL